MKQIIINDFINAFSKADGRESHVFKNIGISDEFISYFQNNRAIITNGIINKIVYDCLAHMEAQGVSLILDSGSSFSVADFVNKVVNRYITVIHTIMYTKSNPQTESEVENTKSDKKKKIAKFSIINCILLVVMYFVVKKFTKTELGKSLYTRMVNLIKNDDNPEVIDAEEVKEENDD